MSLPVVSVRIAFGVAPFTRPGSGDWVDVTSYVRIGEGNKITIRRGRDNEMNDVRAGTCEFILNNFDLRFLPLYSGSPHYPNVAIDTRVEVYAAYSGTEYRRFTGYIQEWKPVFTTDGDSFIRVSAVDGFGLLARYGIQLLYTSTLPFVPVPAQLSGARCAAILDAVGWGSNDRMSGLSTTGTTLVLGDPDYLVQDTNALDEIKKTVTDTEFGVAFIDRDGKFTMQDRRYRLAPAGSPAMFGDSTGAGEYGYERLEMDFSERMLFTRALVRAKAVERKQTITLTGTNTGSGRIQYKGRWTPTFTWNMTPDQVASVLRSLPRLRGKIDAVTGTAGSSYDVYFGEGEGDERLVIDQGTMNGTVSVTAHQGEVQLAAVASSTAPRTYNNGVLETLHVSDAEAFNLAQAIVARYGTPQMRFETFRPRVYDTPAAWPTVLSADVGTYVGGRRRYASATIELTGFIEGISESTDGYEWNIDWQVSPLDPTIDGNTYFTLDDATSGVLDGGYALAP